VVTSLRERILIIDEAYAAFRLDYRGGASTCSSFGPAIKTLEMPCRSTSRVVVSGGQCECATSFEVTTDRRRVASVRRGLLIDLRRLFMIVPPGLRDATCVAWFCRWSAEHVPIGEPVRSLVPVRNPIAARADHSVEYPAGHRQARAAIGCDDLVDERIDDWIGNADEPFIVAACEEK
jgi:hypothetical protein